MTTPEIEELKSLIEQNTERCSVPLQTSRSFQSTSNKNGARAYPPPPSNAYTVT